MHFSHYLCIPSKVKPTQKSQKWMLSTIITVSHLIYLQPCCLSLRLTKILKHYSDKTKARYLILYNSSLSIPAWPTFSSQTIPYINTYIAHIVILQTLFVHVMCSNESVCIVHIYEQLLAFMNYVPNVPKPSKLFVTWINKHINQAGAEVRQAQFKLELHSKQDLHSIK